MSDWAQLGAVRWCMLPSQVKTDALLMSDACYAHVSAVRDDSGCFPKLMKTLGLPESKFSTKEMTELKILQKESTKHTLHDSELGCTNIVCHAIDTGTHVPVKQPSYRMPIVQRDKIKHMVEQMQSRVLSSPQGVPVVLVSGSLCFCVDYRKRDSITKKDVFQLPRVDDIFDTLNGTQSFLSLDGY